MMQMLAAGGMPVLSDGLRNPDQNNPRGYYEFELVKSLGRNSEIVAQAEGKVIKVISSLLNHLPPGHEYRVVFMLRPLAEVVASQNRMMERLHQTVPQVAERTVTAAFETHLAQVRGWLGKQRNMSVLYVEYPSILEDPVGEATRISMFLDRDLDVDGMVRQVERSLHRERVPA
jgi:hypothetical protein